MGKSKVPYPNATHLPTQEIRPYEGIIKASWMIMVVNHPLLRLYLFCGDKPGIREKWGARPLPLPMLVFHPGDVLKHPKDVKGLLP